MCAHPTHDLSRLSFFQMDNASDPAKLYQIDGVEYDAKGVRELIEKLKAADKGGSADDLSGGAGSKSSLLQELLTSNWHALRTLKVCHEPGGVIREGQTMADVVRRKREQVC